MLSMNFTLQSQLRQKAGYRLEQLDGELLLYHLQEERVIYCNTTASLIWQLCDGQRTLAELIALLREAFPEASETLAADVMAAAQQLLDAGCVQLT